MQNQNAIKKLGRPQMIGIRGRPCFVTDNRKRQWKFEMRWNWEWEQNTEILIMSLICSLSVRKFLAHTQDHLECKPMIFLTRCTPGTFRLWMRELHYIVVSRQTMHDSKSGQGKSKQQIKSFYGSERVQNGTFQEPWRSEDSPLQANAIIAARETLRQSFGPHPVSLS